MNWSDLYHLDLILIAAVAILYLALFVIARR
jgi:hypothetical protein